MTDEELLVLLLPLFRELEAIIKEIEKEAPVDTPKVSAGLSPRLLTELASHEGVVLETYKDSKGILTWGIGVTNTSGHRVERYIDNPQTMKRVLEIYEWLVRTKYLPDVLEAFKGKPLTEEQLAAALSFHYNTGAIKEAAWVKSFLKGNVSKAKAEIMNWRSPPEIIPRRKKERDLFFDGKWSNNGTVNVYTRVRKPSLIPDWSSAKRFDITKEFDK